MASAVKTSVTELPDSRVRVDAEVPAEEVERRVHQTAKALARDMRIPGFRKGKVPPPVVVRRVGRAAVLDEAIRGSLGTWYVDAIDAAGIVPVGDPQLDLGDPPGEGEPLTFTIEIGVRPTAKLGTYKGLEVGRREPEASDEDIDREVEALRERFARLETVDRPAEEGDFVVIDYKGTLDGEPFEGGEGRDQLVELGSGRLIPGMEEGLIGAKAGEERTIDVTFPDDYQAEHLAGRPARFAITVNEVKHKELPELDDDFAVEAAGFDTLEELRADVRERLEEAERAAIESEFRRAVLDAAVAEASVDIPAALVAARAREMWEQVSATLQRQGISKETYLRMSGKSEEDVLKEAEPEAERDLRREAVLAAVVEAEGIEATEEELLDAVRPAAEREGTKPEKLLARLLERGRADAIGRDIATRKALDLLVEHAVPISVEQAQARDKLWTPGRGDDAEEAPARGRLWTPGS